MLRRWAVGLCLGLLCALPVLADVAATVVFASGQPRILAADGSARAVQRGSEMRAGETIETRDGRVQLRFRDGAGMSLQPETSFRVDRFRFGGERVIPDDGVLMTLIKGGLRTVTGWLGKQDRRQYLMRTTVATIGIRGTEFGALLDETGLLVSTYAGRVEVCSDVACQEVAPLESVWVRAPGVRPELRRDGAMRVPDRADVMPEAPVVRETPALPSPAAPAPQPTAPPPSFNYDPQRMQSPATQPSRP